MSNVKHTAKTLPGFCHAGGGNARGFAGSLEERR